MLSHKIIHHRLGAAIAGLAIVGLTLTACAGSGDTTDAGTTTTTTTTPSGSGTAAAGTAAEAADEAEAGSVAADTTAPADAGGDTATAQPEATDTGETAAAPPADGAGSTSCPSSEELRQAAVGTSVGDRANQPISFGPPSCADGWAIAYTPAEIDPQVQRSSILFREEGGAWVPVDIGSALNCTGANGVPPDAAAQLPACY